MMATGPSAAHCLGFDSLWKAESRPARENVLGRWSLKHATERKSNVTRKKDQECNNCKIVFVFPKLVKAVVCFTH